MKPTYFLCILLATFNLTANFNIIESISVKKNQINVTPNQEFKKDYLTANFFVQYEDDTLDLTKLDTSIVTIPYTMSIIPMIWISGKTWHIDVMDEDLYFSLKRLKKIYTLFYPQEKWLGELIPTKIVKNSIQSNNNEECAILFSLGLDSTYSSFAHLDKKQLLICIQGIDIPLNNTTMWTSVKNQTKQYAQNYNQNYSYISSNYYSFAKKNNIKIPQTLRQYWWLYTLMSVAYSGLAAPLAYMHGISDLYLGSSYTQEYPYPLGTHPLIDNNIALLDISVHHDGAHFLRHNKIKYIKECAHTHALYVPKLRVCWGHDKNGGNCLNCEKCLRTIHNILVELLEPNEFGFEISLPTIIEKTKKFFHNKKLAYSTLCEWGTIQEKIKEQLNNPTTLPNELKEHFIWLSSLDLKKFSKDDKKTIELKEQTKAYYQTLWNIGVQGQTNMELLEKL